MRPASFLPPSAALAALALLATGASAQQPLVFPRSPVLSPDGRTLAFSYQGDIWTAPVDRAEPARRLTVHPGYDRPVQFSPDGRTLLFASNRLGRVDAWTMPADGGAPTLLTHFSGGSAPQGWSADGRRVLVAATRELQPFGPALYTVAAGPEPGRPRPVLATGRTLGGQLSPDGKTLLFARGSNDWSRRGYRGDASADLYVHPLGTKQARRLTDFDGQDMWPQWLPGGREALFVSERDGTHNLWKIALDSGRATPVTRHKGDGVRFPSVAADGSRVAYEIADRIEVLDLKTPGATPRPLALVAPVDFRRNTTETLALAAGASGVAVSPDGEQTALVLRGDIFVVGRDGGRAQQVTDAPERDEDPVWSADGKSLYFVSRRDGNPELYRVASADPDETRLARARRFQTTRLTRTSESESEPRIAPDGKTLAFLRDERTLWTCDPDGGGARQVFAGLRLGDIAWSPDSRWFALVRSDEEFNAEVLIVAADGSGKPVNVSMHPRNDTSPAWSPDGAKLFFLSERVDRENDVWMVYLRREDHERTAEEWARLRERNRPAPGAAPAPRPAPREVVVDADEIHRRVRRLTTLRGSEGAPAVSGTDGRTQIAFRAGDDGPDLALIDLTDGAPAPTPRRVAVGGFGALEWSRDGRTLTVLRRDGGIGTLAAGGDALRPLAFRARLTVDRAAFQRVVFEEAWQALDRAFYDPKFHGADWPALREKYRPMAMAAADPADFADVVRLMMGHLNASHIGYNPAAAPDPDAPAPATGFVGTVWDETYAGPGLKVARVVLGSPADARATRIAPGEIVTAVNGVPLGPDTDPDTLLADTVGERTVLSVTAVDGTRREVALQPLSYAALSGLLYDELVAHRRDDVHRLSGGRLAYLHIRAMDQVSQDAFEQGLYAEGYGRDGLLIDVRDNGGGSTADYLLTMLALPRHAYTIGRDGAPGYPQDRLPLYPWRKSAALLINERAYSNAEIFAHAFKGLGRGPVVGIPTFGAVISTGAGQLLDGSSVRTPGRGWYRIADGVNQEHSGAQPDLRVDRTPADELEGRDPQLEAAVKALLANLRPERLPEPKRPRSEGADRP